MPKTDFDGWIEMPPEPHVGHASTLQIVIKPTEADEARIRKEYADAARRRITPGFGRSEEPRS